MIEAIAWKWPGLQVSIKGDQIYANIKLHSLDVLEEKIADLGNHVANIQDAASAEEHNLTGAETAKIATLTATQATAQTDINNLTEVLPTETEIDTAVLEHNAYMASEVMNKAKLERVEFLRKKQADQTLTAKIAQINAATNQAEIDAVDI